MYSRRCCERVAENAAIDILYAFIRSCNRSEPHVEVLKHALVILRNVASHKALRPAVGEPPEAVETLVDLAQMFRDKEHILVQSVNLITIITNDQGAQKVSNGNFHAGCLKRGRKGRLPPAQTPNEKISGWVF